MIERFGYGFSHDDSQPPRTLAHLLGGKGAHLAEVEEASRRRFTEPDDPLLLSVRSGPPRSMPGKLDTLLNVGLYDVTVGGLAQASGNPAFAEDSCRRLRATSRTAGLPGALPRLSRYRRRLDTALTAVEGGDHRRFTPPMANSYHDVWMAMHEELIDRRAEEASATQWARARR